MAKFNRAIGEKDIFEWVARPTNYTLLKVDAIKEIEESISLCNKVQWVAAACSLSRLAVWCSIFGYATYLREDEKAVQRISLALRCEMVSTHILLSLWRQDTRRTKQARYLLESASTFLAFSMAVKSDIATKHFGEMLLNSTADKSLGRWDNCRFPQYMLYLYCTHVVNIRVPSGFECTESPYSDIVQHWASPTKVAEALESACEYHVLSGIHRDENLEEFGDYPFHIWGVEIVATLNLLQKAQGISPVIQHPLMQGRYPDLSVEDLTEITDENLLEQVKYVLKADEELS